MPNLLETFERVTNEPIRLPLDGEVKKITGKELFVRNLQARACKGEAAAMRIYADLLKSIGGGREQAPTGHEDFLASLGSGPPPDPDLDPS